MAKKGMEGIVIGKSENRVKIRVFRNNTCEDCDCVLQDACDPDSPLQGRRGMFDLFTDRSVLEIEATNAASADIGDRILVKMRQDSSLVKASAFMYLVPGMMFVVGLFVGGWLGDALGGLTGDGLILAQLAGGVVFLLASFGWFKVYLNQSGTDEFLPEVTEIIRRAEPDQLIHPV